MEVNKQKNRDPKDYASKKVPDFTDVTILNTPLPQATSTVDRRSLIQGKSHRSIVDEHSNGQRQLNFDTSNANSEESSLGIIQNISSLLDDSTFDELRNKECPARERELARKLLLKCNESLVSNLQKVDKENNVNSSNLQRNSNVHNYVFNSKNYQSDLQTRSSLNQRHSIDDGDDQTSSAKSIVFEPTEISARSSEFNKTPEKTDPFPQNSFSGISYNSNLAEIMGQFGDEDFMSGSKADSQIMADELSWKRNKLASLPLSSSDKDRLELSCFSGIVGDVDLSVDGGRVSVGEFFKQKCGGTGHLSISSNVSDRPSFGLNAQSPVKRGKLQPLVDKTVTSENSYYPEEKEIKSADCTKDPSVLSLSSIAQVLQDIDSATPRKLVDQILDANKKKKKQKAHNKKTASDTYAVIPGRSSLPISTTLTHEKPERDFSQSSFGNKLSLGNRNMSGLDSKNFSDLLTEENLMDEKLKKLLEMKLDDITLETTQDLGNTTNDRASLQNRTSLQSRPSLQSHRNLINSPTMSIPRAELSMMPPRQLSHLPNPQNKFMNSTSIKNDSSLIHDTVPSDISDPTMTKNDSSLKEDTLTSSLTKSFETKKVEVGKKTQELCTCLVGIPKEADFELCNGTDRWIICSLKLHQIQGEKENIQLSLPTDDILVGPDSIKSFKIGVTMPRMGKLTLAIFHIPCQDMVTKTNWNMKHMMCFVPEEPCIKVSIQSNNDTLDFHTITEDTTNSLPITLENKNSIDIPVLLSLNQDKPKLFSIGDYLDETINSVHTASNQRDQRDSVYVTLKPMQPLTLNLDFKGMSLQSFGEKCLYKANAIFRVAICFRENEEYLIKDVPLKGVVGSCKLDIVDVQFPLSLQPRVGRIVSMKNTGSVSASATVDIVQSKENQIECRDFFICPNNIILEEGGRLALQVTYKPENNKTDNERHAMIRLIVGNRVSFYPIIGEKSHENEQLLAESSHQLQRCETPQRLRSEISPSSPHSLMFNRSGASGRHSPGSTVSGGTVAGVIVPIRSTHTALVWGSIKAGKTDTKQFTIRNTSNNKIKLFVTIKSTDQIFKFIKDRHSAVSSMSLSLQGMESKTLSVIFGPHSPKAASGKVIFSHYSTWKESREISGLVKTVQLFGYGGYGKVEISEAIKDTSGQMWLSLGKLSSEGVLFGKLKLYNSGDLPSFIKIKLIPKALYPSVLSNWNLDPTEILLEPNQVQWVTMEFRPKKDDLEIAHTTGVIHVGTLRITHGDEPTRLRIRRLYNKLKDSDQLSDKVSEQADEFRETIYPLSKAFPGEVCPPDLRLIKDSVQNLGDLCKGIVQNEVKLTVEVHADETMSMLQDNMDDSQAFYSLCSDHDNESHFGGESFLPTD